MGKILKIEDGKVSIGLAGGEMIVIPIAAVSYDNPKVGDEVKVYRSGDSAMAAKPTDTDAESAFNSAYGGYSGSSAGGTGNNTSSTSGSGTSSTYTYGNGNYTNYGNTNQYGGGNMYGNEYPYNLDPSLYGANIKTYNKHLFVWVFTFLIGGLGIDRFLRGQIGYGILKLLTCGGLGVWSLVDFIIALSKAYGHSFRYEPDFVFINGFYAK